MSTASWRLNLSEAFSVLNRLRREDSLCDLVVHATHGLATSRFPAHKVVLVAVSPYFRQVLHQDLLSEKHFFLPSGVDPRVFGIVLDFMYGIDVRECVEAMRRDSADLDPTIVFDRLLNSAKFLGLDDLAEALRGLIVVETAAAVSGPIVGALTAPSGSKNSLRLSEDDSVDDEDDAYSLPTQVPYVKSFPSDRGKKRGSPSRSLGNYNNGNWPGPAGFRLDLNNRYFRDLGQDKSSRNVQQPTDKGELSKYLPPPGVLKVIQKMDAAAIAGKVVDDVVTYDNRQVDFLGKKVFYGQKASEVWPWKSEDILVRGEIKTVSGRRTTKSHAHVELTLSPEAAASAETDEDAPANKSRAKIRAHRNQPVFTCPYCGDVVKHKFVMVGHLLRKHGYLWKDQTLACNLCSFISSRKAVMICHVERVHKVLNPVKKKYICRVCGGNYSNNGSLKVHETICFRKQNQVAVREEEGYLYYEEDVLDNGEVGEGEAQNELDDHPEAHSEFNGEMKDLLDDEVKVKSENWDYIKEEPIEEDQVEAKPAAAETSGLRRSRRQPPPLRIQPPPPPLAKPRVVKKIKRVKVYDYRREHLCQICGKSFKCHQQHKKHVQEHNGVLEKFHCKEENCEFVCNSSSSLVAHLYARHKINVESREILKCPYCEYTTLLKNVLRRHIQFHENKRQFVCDFENCGLGFNSKGTLRRHFEGVHDKTHNVACKLCGAEFSLQTRLNAHVKLMHTERGVKNWKCGYCSHASALRGNCRKHQKNEHKGLAEFIVDLKQHRILQQSHLEKEKRQEKEPSKQNNNPINLQDLQEQALPSSAFSSLCTPLDRLIY